MRIIKLFTFLLLAIVFTLLTIRLLLLDQFVAMSLQRAGATDITVHISDISWNHIHIDHLNATFKLPNGKRVRTKTKGISLHYRLEHLLKAKKCDLLEIEKMEIRLTGIKTNPQPTHFPNRISLLKDTTRALLPLENLQIKKLLLHGDLPEQITNKVIQIVAAIKGTAIDITTTLQMETDTVASIILHSPDSEHTIIDIAGHLHQTDIFQSKIILQPDGLTGTIGLQISPVRNLVLATSKFPVIKGHLNGTFSLPLPLQDDSNIQAMITLSDNHHQQIRLEVITTPKKQNINLLFRAFVKEQECLKTRLTANQQSIRGNYTIHAGLLRSFLTPYSQRPLPEISGSLIGTLEMSLTENERKDFTTTAMLSSPALFGFTASTTQIQLTGSLEKDRVILDSGSTFLGKNIAFANTKIQECNLDLAGIFKKDEDQFQLSFAEGQSLILKGLTTEKVHIADIHFRPEYGLQVDLDNKSWSVRENTLNIDPLHIETETGNINTEPLTCTISTLNNVTSIPTISAELVTPGIVINTTILQLPLKELIGAFQLENRQLSGQTQFSPATIPGKIGADFKHNLSTTAGTFEIHTNKTINLNGEGASLANLFNNWQLPLDLDNGTIAFTADGTWKTGREMQVSAFAAITGGSGYYKQYLFEGLEIQQDLVILPQLHSNREGSFSLRQLIGGIDIHKLSSNVTFLPSKTGILPRIQINNFDASLLGGIVNIPNIVYDFNQPDSNFTVDIKGMNLETIVNLVKIKGLHVNGKISGAIPVTIKGKAISVNNGKLYNEPPGGEISYAPKNINSAGLTGYALKAVEDFQYDSLTATAIYDPSGQLDLDISLQGISPKLDNSRQVHLNIHAEQNLPALLQSLRYSKGLTEELDKQVQQRYK